MLFRSRARAELQSTLQYEKQMNTIENRLMELEAKVAFQDETIEILNDELKAHQQQLAKMKRQTELLAEKLKEAQQPSLMSQMQEPPPPHY